jgi:hypothetical protein
MTIIEPYITKCHECKTVFRFSEGYIQKPGNDLKFGTMIFDCLDGFVVCPTCGNLITSWDKHITTNDNTYCVDVVYATCLREAFKETCSDRISDEEFSRIFKLATKKFHDVVCADLPKGATQ